MATLPKKTHTQTLEITLRILATVITAILFTATAPAFAQDQQSVLYYHTQNVVCQIDSDDINEKLPDPGSTFNVDIKCNSEFGLTFEDDAGSANTIVMDKIDDLESTDDYDETFNVGVTYTSGLETAAVGGQFAGEFKAQNATAVYTLEYTLPDNLEAGEYEGAGVVTIIPVDIPDIQDVVEF